MVAEPSIAWVEYQSRADTISFYRFDPVALKRIAGDRLDGKPVIRRVQIHDMLSPELFARYRRNVLRLHYQSVMANERRAPYDYYLMVCGPVAFSRLDDGAARLPGFRLAGRHAERSRAARTVAAEPVP